MAALRLLVFTGARLSEILELRWEHVDFENGTIALPSRKGGGRKAHPVSAGALAVLADLPRVKGSPFVLPSPTTPKKQHLSKSVMKNAWRCSFKAPIKELPTRERPHRLLNGSQSRLKSGIPSDGASAQLDMRISEQLNGFVGYSYAPEIDGATIADTQSLFAGLAYDVDPTLTLRAGAAREFRASFDRTTVSLGMTKRF